jgi:sphingosine kinase
MVDLDIGTESIRWLGDSRFVLGFLKGVVTNKKEKTRLRMKVVDDDKVEMARRARQWAGEKRGRKIGGGVDPIGKGEPTKGMGVGNGSGENGERGSRGNGGDEPTRAGEGGEEGKGEEKGNGDKGGENEHGHEGEQEDDTEKEGAIPDSKPLEPDSTWMTIESGGTGRGDESGNGSPVVKRDAKGGAWVDGQGIMYT